MAVCDLNLQNECFIRYNGQKKGFYSVTFAEGNVHNLHVHLGCPLCIYLFRTEKIDCGKIFEEGVGNQCFPLL